MTTEDLIDLLDQAVPLSTEERTAHQARWQTLRTENAPLRVIQGEALVSAQFDYFDTILLRHATRDWKKMVQIVGDTFAEFYDAGVYQTCDLVLAARLAVLAETGCLEWRGDLAHMRHCELRLPAVPH
ncbi:DUF3658 domain-containing protein [Rhodopila sp.]|uniref:DUF3658 domain-containing protein n=1 Tax=Rhodopila sp. TaxID=2480087 RepID=UPI003D0DFAA4